MLHAGFLEAALLVIGSRAITAMFRVGRAGLGVSAIPAALLSGALTLLCMRMGVCLPMVKHAVSATTWSQSRALSEHIGKQGPAA